MWRDIMEAIFRTIAEILSIFRISKQAKQEEAKIKQKEIFVERAKQQEEVTIKDQDEKLIADTIAAKDALEREKKLDEIRKIISK